MRVWFLAFACAIGCAREAPPYGEAIVIVDIDVQIPRLASRLRLDVYSADRARWIDSREVELADPKQWPASFSIYNRSDTEIQTVVVRLRAFPQGITRDYKGERYTPRSPATPPGDPAPVGRSPPGASPRLRDGTGADSTPFFEPSPAVAIDRLFVVRLQPGIRGTVPVVLRGECIGTMANLAGGRTCVDQENVLVDAPELAPDPNFTKPPAVTRAFGARVPCDLPLRTPTPGLLDDEVCVPGGGFVLGNADGFGEGAFSSSPQRIAVLPPFRMDKYEVTVRRWRTSGFASPDDSPYENNATFGIAGVAACTYSTDPAGREDYPMNCVSVGAARAFCQSIGGDLPTETEWRWVAQDAERDRKTLYPWGDDPPSCLRAVYARLPGMNDNFFDVCVGSGRGPRPELELSGEDGDVAIGTNVVNLAGNVSEMGADAFHGFGERCWASLGLRSPQCIDDALESNVDLGAAWDDNVVSTASKTRRAFPKMDSVGAPELGFRCVRRGDP